MNINDLWVRHYVHRRHGVCVLCGNSGIIDTTETAISPLGQHVGGEHYCFCPNGRELRAIERQEKRAQRLADA